MGDVTGQRSETAVRCRACAGTGGDPLSISCDDPDSEFYGMPTGPCPVCGGSGRHEARGTLLEQARFVAEHQWERVWEHTDYPTTRHLVGALADRVAALEDALGSALANGGCGAACASTCRHRNEKDCTGCEAQENTLRAVLSGSYRQEDK